MQDFLITQGFRCAIGPAGHLLAVAAGQVPARPQAGRRTVRPHRPDSRRTEPWRVEVPDSERERVLPTP